MFNKVTVLHKTSILCLFVFITLSCAKIGNIEGGPKDITPPIMVNSKPANYALNFNSRKIEIEFNEFLQLNDVNTQLNVSPPLKKKPKVLLYNKIIKIEIADTLLDSTTYTFNFGKAIGDFNENNIVNNFEFVVSTTNYLDSMAVKGNLYNAFDLKPYKDPVTVMLYSSLTDTAPYRLNPTFVCRSNAKGEFYLNNIKPGKYNIYALKDVNNNNRFDPPTEEFAFIDSLIILNSSIALQLIKLDSIKIKQADSITQQQKAEQLKKLAKNNKSAVKHENKLISTDSLKTDTVVEIRNMHHALPISLYLFKDYDYKQYLRNTARSMKQRVELVFNRPLITDTLEVMPLNYNNTNWCIKEANLALDSFKFWITDTALLNTDTFRLVVKYTENKSGREWASKTDTLFIKYTPKEITVKKKKKKDADKNEQIKPEKMKVECSLTGGNINLGSDITFTCQFPISSICTDSIKLYQTIDSLDTPQKFIFEKDSIPYKFKLKYTWKESQKYRLLVLPGAFNNIYSYKHDSINIKFSSPSAEQYGKLILTINNVKQATLIQLLDGEKVVRQKAIKNNGKVYFEYLNPAKYAIKYIFDDNENNKWDTGNYANRKQPEKVGFITDILNVRANWDLEQTIHIADKHLTMPPK